MGVKDSVSILLCVPLQRGGWVSRTVSVYCYACHYRGVDGCQGQRQHIVMRATTEGWMGVKECHCVTVMRATTGGGGGGQGQCQYVVMRVATGGWMGVKDSVRAMKGGGWEWWVGDVKDSVGMWLCVLLQRGGWVSRTVSVVQYRVCHYRTRVKCSGGGTLSCFT